MSNRIATLATLILAFMAAGIAAQPPDHAVYPGDEEHRFADRQADRLARMTDYLDLSESQTAEWQEITSRHLDAMHESRGRMTALRDEFRSLAEQENPNLEQVGQVALDLHREMESVRSGRDDLLLDLEAILTPEQAEKLEALETAREFAADRGRRGMRGERGERRPPRRD